MLPGMGTQHRISAITAALLTIGLTAACTGDDDGGGRGKNGTQVQVEMTEVKGNEALRPEKPVINGFETLVMGKRETVIANIAHADGKPTQLQAIDPSTRKRVALEVTEPTSWTTASNDHTAVVAGNTSTDGMPTPFVRVSSDLKTWKTVEISAPGQGWLIQTVGLDGDTPLLFMSTPDDTTMVMRLEGTSPEAHEIPAAKGEALGTMDMVEHGSRLLLLADEGAVGGESVSRVFSSTDGGTTWTRGGDFPGDKGTYSVSGMVSTGRSLVASGWADAKEATTGMVWTSTDGTDWTAKRTPSVAWEDYVEPQSTDFWLTAPMVIDGRVVFDQTCDDCTSTTRFETSGSGGIKQAGAQKLINATGPYVSQLLGENAGVRMEQGSLRMYEGSNSHDLVAGQERASVDGVHLVGDTTLVAVDQYKFTRAADDGWSTRSHTTPFVLDPGLTQEAWRPTSLSSWSGLHTETSPDGKTTVAVGTLESDGGFSADSRAVTDGQVRLPKGLDREKYESVGGVTYAADDFLMDLIIRKEDSWSVSNARVYSSPDGVTWTPDKGTWTQNAKGNSSISHVCELGDGTALAVGSSQAGPNDRSEATTWTRTKGTWAIHLPEVDETASVSGCATVDDVTIVSGYQNGQSTEWTTTDGKTFTKSQQLPRGHHRSNAQEHDGGLVASGWLETAEHHGPVLWTSLDGTSWNWSSVEGGDGASGISLLPAGDELYVIVSKTSGDRMWTLDGLTSSQTSGD